MEVNHGGQVLSLTYNSPGHVREIEKHGKFFEYGMLEAIASLPYRNGICMDIGANVGNHTVFFSRFCNFDEVWSYEPHPQSFEILKENVKENCTRTVRTFNCAIGAQDGNVRFVKDKENPSESKITKGKGTTRIIPIRTNLKVALMKIDVEGHEIEVIRGAYDVIERERPELFVEHHGDPQDLLDELPEGYKFIKTYNNSPTHHLSAQ